MENPKTSKFSRFFGLLMILFSLLAIWSLHQSGWLSKPLRFVASDELDGLTQGQRDKRTLIESFDISTDPESFNLKSIFLPQLCLNHIKIEIDFSALGIAVNGEAPIISVAQSCTHIQESQDPESFSVSWDDFLKMHQTEELSNVSGDFKSSNLFSLEQFPGRWFIKEIRVDGSNSFRITEYELAKVRGRNFEFEAPSSTP